MTRSVALQDIPASDLRTLDDILNRRAPAAPVPAAGKPEARATTEPRQPKDAAYLGPWGAWLGL